MKKVNKTKIRPVRLTEKEDASLVEVSKLTKISVSEVIRRCVNKYLTSIKEK